MRSYPVGWKERDGGEGWMDERGDIKDKGRRMEVMEDWIREVKKD